VQTQHQQRLREAWLEWRKVNPKKRTMLALIKRARLDGLSVVSLSRKLSGERGMTDEELVALARALGVSVKVERTIVTLGAAA
jgi:alkylhydroperoxidase family enzyme